MSKRRSNGRAEVAKLALFYGVYLCYLTWVLIQGQVGLLTFLGLLAFMLICLGGTVYLSVNYGKNPNDLHRAISDRSKPIQVYQAVYVWDFQSLSLLEFDSELEPGKFRQILEAFGLSAQYDLWVAQEQTQGTSV